MSTLPKDKKKPEEPNKPAPFTKKETVGVEAAMETLEKNMSVIIDKRVPDIVDSAKLGLKEETKRDRDKSVALVEGATKGGINEIQSSTTDGINMLKEKAVEFIGMLANKVDDFAQAAGADPKLVAALKMLEDPETREMMKKVATGIGKIMSSRQEIGTKYQTYFMVCMTMMGIGIGIGWLIWGYGG